MVVQYSQKQPFVDVLKHVFFKNSQYHLCWSRFLIKLQTRTQVFSCEYCKSFESSFFIEHLRWLLCGNCRRILKGFQLKVKIGMKLVDFEHAKHVRSSHWRCSVKKGVLKNFAKFLRTPFLQNIHSGCF